MSVDENPPPSEATPLARLLANPLAAAALYLALAVAMTLPLLFRLSTHLPAGSVDLWQNHWNFWWWKKCILELGRHPYTTQYLFHPSGADMTFYTHSVFNMIASLPANLLWGPAAAYNFCVILSAWLCGLGAYLLARDVTGDARAAFLAGVVFAFFPQRQEQTLEHLNLFSVQFIPIALFYALRLFREGGAINILGLAFSFALNAFCDWHLALKLTLTLAPAAAIALAMRPRPFLAISRDLVIAGAIAAGLVIPVAWPLIGGMAGGDSFFQKGAQDRGIDPFYLFVPPYHHPLVGGLVSDLYAKRAYEAAGFVCYLGFVPAALAVWALVRAPRKSALWWAFLLASIVMALGAHTWWRGELVDGVTLPFAILAKLPVLSLMRIANRFMILASLALAVLVALGWSSLRRAPDGAFLAVLALVLLEYLWLPYPTQKLDDSPFYSQLAKGGPAGYVLDLPFTLDGVTVQNMRAQTIHGRPIAGGYLSTLPPEPRRAVETDPALGDLVGLGPKLAQPLNVAHLRSLGFGVAILHKDRAESAAVAARAAADPRDLFERKALNRIGGVPDAKFKMLRDELERACGAPIYEDDMIAAYELKP